MVHLAGIKHLEADSLSLLDTTVDDRSPLREYVPVLDIGTLGNTMKDAAQFLD